MSVPVYGNSTLSWVGRFPLADGCCLAIILRYKIDHKPLQPNFTVLETVASIHVQPQLRFLSIPSHDLMFCFLQVSIDECQSLPCRHGGVCSESTTPGEYTCSCVDGWTGQNCESLPQFCNDSTCDNSGVCFSLQNSFFCQSVNRDRGLYV